MITVAIAVTHTDHHHTIIEGEGTLIYVPKDAKVVLFSALLNAAIIRGRMAKEARSFALRGSVTNDHSQLRPFKNTH